MRKFLHYLGIVFVIGGLVIMIPASTGAYFNFFQNYLWYLFCTILIGMTLIISTGKKDGETNTGTFYSPKGIVINAISFTVLFITFWIVWFVYFWPGGYFSDHIANPLFQFWLFIFVIELLVFRIISKIINR